MNIDELYNSLESMVIEESLRDFIYNPRLLATAAVILGLTHYTYTVPKLREIVSSKLRQSTPEQVQRLTAEIKQKSNTPVVDKFIETLKKIGTGSKTSARPLSDNLIKDLSTIKYPAQQKKSDPNAFLSQAYDYIKKSEGVRNKMYQDIYGNWTIGIGHLVKPEELAGFENRTLSEKEIQDIFKADINKKLELIRKHFGETFDEYSDKLKIVILDGYFRGDLSGSPKARLLLKLKRFPEAAKEYLDNAEYRKAKDVKSGIASRMEQNAQIIAGES